MNPVTSDPSLDRALATLSQHLARLDWVKLRPVDDPLAPDPATDLARLHAAQAALDLAAALLTAASPQQAHPLAREGRG